MALSWTQRTLAVSSTWKTAMRDFVDNVLSGLTHWQVQGGGADTNFKFDSGDAGIMLQRVTNTIRFALLYYYDPAGSQTDKFTTSTHHPFSRFVSTTINHSPGVFQGVLDTSNSLWTNRTDFFGATYYRKLIIGAITAGPFDIGETLTIDSAGDNATATLVDVITDFNSSGDNCLIISGLSALPTTTWLSKTVSGGTSGASATTTGLNYNHPYWHEDIVSDIYLAGGDFPIVTNVLTGSTSGHVGTVTAVDAATGKVTVNTQTHGRFQLGETITWNAGANSSVIGWMPRNMKSIFGSTQGLLLPGVDPVIDNTPYLVAEDADRLGIFLPYPTGGYYMCILIGKWWESLIGGGRHDGFAMFLGSTPLMAADLGAGGVLDHQGFPQQFRNSIIGQAGIQGPCLNAVRQQSMLNTQKFHYFLPGQSTDGNPIRIAQPVIYYDSTDYQRDFIKCPELFLVPAQTWKHKEQPGSWGSVAPSALHLGPNGLCVQMTDPSITP